MKDSPTAALLLVNRLAKVDGAKPLSAREYWNLLNLIPDPGTLLGLGVDQVRTLGLDPEFAERVVRLLDASIPFAFERERLESSGIQVVSTLDETFPNRLQARLGTACPAFLLVVGLPTWIDSGGLGVVGSRDVNDSGAEVARRAAVAAADRGEPVVSGHARGVDQIAISATLERGGRVTGIPSEGLTKVARGAAVRHAVLAEQLCLVSPYGPMSPFSAANAMARNKLIYALADRTFVVASDKESGGTWAGATEALQRHFGPVAVWLGDGGGPGNVALTHRGASPIHNLDDLTGELQPSGQLALDSLPDSVSETRVVEESGPIMNGAEVTASAAPCAHPDPTGVCWCGCGAPVEDGEFFAARHDANAAIDAVVAVFGSVEAFLAAHGYGDVNPAPKRRRNSKAASGRATASR